MKKFGGTLSAKLFHLLLFINDRTFNDFDILRCFDNFSGIETHFFGAAKNVLIGRVIHFGRAAQNPKIFALRVADRGILIIIVQINDPVIAPNCRNKG
jgi:hypothetical protein